MPKIHKLSHLEIQKIAAGEVIERPANVVKELIENSLDAGATEIYVYIKKAGKELLRVVDNGSGMEPEDARICFEHHTTSKLSTIDDLNSLRTFGFRGEALSSIASVSTITLITKTANTHEATKLQLHQGTLVDETVVSAPQGTDIAIYDLLENVPARKKFLKTDETELRHIVNLIQAVAFSHKELHIELIHEGKHILRCPRTADLKNRYTQIYHDTNVPVHCFYEDEEIRIEGIASDYTAYRYDRLSSFFFVNGRWVKNQPLSRALLRAYANALPAHTYPFAALSIVINPAKVDVNFHPRKEEVQFLNPRKIEVALEKAVRDALERNLSELLQTSVKVQNHQLFKAPEYTHAYEKPITFSAPTSFAPYDFTEFSQTFAAQPSPKPIAVSEQNLAHLQQKTIAAHNQEHDALQEEPEYNVIGTHDATYILLSSSQGIICIDQHAAHERVLYERIKQGKQELASTRLIFPEMISRTADDISRIANYQDLLLEQGIAISIMSATELAITAIPVCLKNRSAQECINELIAGISAQKSEDIVSLRERLQIHLACKSAIKAGDLMSHQEQIALIKDLYKTANRFTCPHGRPTSWLISQEELIKKFHRTYESKQRNDF